ncbi:putative inactive leucine-rich repeat receptor kinase XIAO [Camellia lanceoleosa]|uniref:Inactive leucine-rich repeat receptor kinase XIAO n=1 Tax=Camellia lanceoleosa TaxID=1840588 RepID=A0ACC0GE33_9ERIC|nr:putative inactive leucine-rich repeat receptor kinase XIAO [Camellia lanceoleosa]
MCNFHTNFSSINSRCAILITFLSIVFLLIKFNMATADNVTSMIKCIQTEREALFAFKQGLKDPSNRLSSWIGNDQDYRAYERSYEKSCLGGDINSSLLDLKYLQYLDLSLNDFKGTPIPKFIGMLKNLRYLNLSSASFGGEIPPQLGNLSDLNHLDLYCYYLPISLPISLPFVFTLLSVLDILDNSYNSSIPHWMFNLTRLRTLDLSMNSFQGTIPSEVVNLISLKYLDIYSSGDIEGQSNLFSGSIPSNIDELMPQLRGLYLSDNHLNGTIPSSICTMNSLQVLSLRTNQLSRELP